MVLALKTNIWLGMDQELTVQRARVSTKDGLRSYFLNWRALHQGAQVFWYERTVTDVVFVMMQYIITFNGAILDILRHSHALNYTH